MPHIDDEEEEGNNKQIEKEMKSKENITMMFAKDVNKELKMESKEKPIEGKDNKEKEESKDKEVYV